MPLEGFIHIRLEYLYPYANNARKIATTKPENSIDNARKIIGYKEPYDTVTWHGKLFLDNK